MVEIRVSKKGSELRNRTTIDVTNAKILKILLKESRTSFTEIAKDCKISVGAIRKRYKRLRKAGIINGEIMQVNPHSLGYKCIVNIGIITARKDESKVTELLKSKPYTCVVFRNVFERANIATIISLHEFEELSETMRDIEANPLIKHANAFIWSKTSGLDHPENLVLTPSISKTDKETHPKPNTTNLEKAKIDKTDRQIAKILSQNSRTPFTKIAEELNISTKKVIRRYNKLRGTVLASSTITVDLNKLGYKAAAHLLMKGANRSKMPEILANLLQIPNLITVIELVGGEYDLFPIIVLRDYEELFKLKEQISTIHGIEQLDMILSKPYCAWPLNLFASLL
jgi:Lrp/AsnC family transcriptional regulator for asnA, asnC and gidA